MRTARLLWQALSSYRERRLTDHAAALTYFGMLSLFPSLLAGIAVLSLFGEASLAPRAAKYLTVHGADPATAEVVRSSLAAMIRTSREAAGATLLLSFALALNGASGGLAAAGRALARIQGIDDERGFVRRKAADLRIALLVILVFSLTVVAMFLGGPVADDLLGTIGLGGFGADLWSIARFPLALVASVAGFSLVYRTAPGRQQDEPRWFSAGAITAVAIWLVASLLFSVYIQNLSSYGAAYGAFGAAIVLLLWLYVSANAFLFGAEFDATRRRAAH